MTSDAKIGLLLGLVFIFAIAFLINGLPRFRSAGNNNELTENMVNSQNGTPGIAARERKVQELFSWEEQVKELPLEADQPPLEDDEDVRFEMPLPEDISVAQDVLLQDVSLRDTADEAPPTSPSAPEPVVPAPTVVETTEVKVPAPAKSVWPKTYVVADGDNLGDIAKKLYGPEQGNKQASVTRIFEVNRALLKSPHEIYVGQKLTIPAPPTSTDEQGTTDDSWSDRLFETVKSIGRKRPSTDRRTAEQSKHYVVKDGDSLWAIAAEQLGSGVRYKEIAKLNADILANDDTLIVGMRLKMPTQ